MISIAANDRPAGPIAVVINSTIQAHSYAATTNFIKRIMVSCVVVGEHTTVILNCVVEVSYGARKETDVAG